MGQRPSVLRSIYERSETVADTKSARSAVELALLRDRLPLPAPGRILDLGCGEGALGAAAQRLANTPVVGADWSKAATELSLRNGLTVVRCSIDGARLPFASGSFGAVLFNEVVEHLIDPDGALDEVQRVLVPGGLLLLSTPNLAAWFNRVLLLAGFQPVFSEVSTRHVYGRPGNQVVGHLRLFTARALLAMIHDRGFAVEALRGAPYHDVPAVLRPIDRLCSRWTGGSSILVLAARTRGRSS